MCSSSKQQTHTHTRARYHRYHRCCRCHCVFIFFFTPFRHSSSQVMEASRATTTMNLVPMVVGVDSPPMARAVPLSLGRKELADWWWSSCSLKCSDSLRPCHRCRTVGRNIKSFSRHRMLEVNQSGQLIIPACHRNPHLFRVNGELVIDKNKGSGPERKRGQGMEHRVTLRHDDIVSIGLLGGKDQHDVREDNNDSTTTTNDDDDEKRNTNAVSTMDSPWMEFRVVVVGQGDATTTTTTTGTTATKLKSTDNNNNNKTNRGKKTTTNTPSGWMTTTKTVSPAKTRTRKRSYRDGTDMGSKAVARVTTPTPGAAVANTAGLDNTNQNMAVGVAITKANQLFGKPPFFRQRYTPKRRRLFNNPTNTDSSASSSLSLPSSSAVEESVSNKNEKKRTTNDDQKANTTRKEEDKEDERDCTTSSPEQQYEQAEENNVTSRSSEYHSIPNDDEDDMEDEPQERSQQHCVQSQAGRQGTVAKVVPSNPHKDSGALIGSSPPLSPVLPTKEAPRTPTFRGPVPATIPPSLHTPGRFSSSSSSSSLQVQSCPSWASWHTSEEDDMQQMGQGERLERRSKSQRSSEYRHGPIPKQLFSKSTNNRMDKQTSRQR